MKPRFGMRLFLGWGLGGFSLLLTLFLTSSDLASTPLLVSEGACSASKQEVVVGCPGCYSTTVFIMCDSVDGNCEGCAYTFYASLNCPGVPPIIEASSGDLECDGKFEKRFGGCGISGSAFGGVVCDCGSCPE